MSTNELSGRVTPAVGHHVTVEEPDNLALHPRDVRFDWSAMPMHWIPGEPVTTHLFNVLHLLLPEGERWFVRTFTEALPYITDERVREDVIGFIGQEAIHAEAHQEVLAHLPAHGLDPRPFVRQIEWLFEHVLAPRQHRSDRVARLMLIERLAVVAAIEHFTAYLGHCALNPRGLDRAGAHPVMLGLTPGYVDLARASLRFLEPSYHPSKEGSTAQAIAYLASSPAPLAAAR